MDNITLIPVSTWLQDQLRQSFLKEQNIITIHNGIDTQIFKPTEYFLPVLRKYKINETKSIILGIASNWFHKGLNDFIQLRKLLERSVSNKFLVGAKTAKNRKKNHKASSVFHAHKT